MKLETTMAENSLMSGRNDSDRRFAVIGAGAAGLCIAKYLIQAGYRNVTIFEIGTQIGGLWCYENDNGLSPCYKTLHINTARNLTQFSDYPFPKDTQLFPSHWDMHAYLKSFAEHFGLVKHIKFRSRVARIQPNAAYDTAAPAWDVVLEDGSVQTFDRLVVASGHLSVPMHAPELKEQFRGEYLHSHNYREPGPFVGKRVCVVGVGNSACDIASDICMTSDNTVLVARSGVMIGPKLLLGIPFTDITFQLYRKWFPDWLRRKLIAFLVYIMHGRMTDLGFKPLTKRAHGTTNAVIVQHIAYNRIRVKQGIEKIDGKRLYFSDGTSEEFDVLIAATGYEIDLPFVPSNVLPVKNNSIDLYKRIVPPSWKGIYFAGFINTTTALNYLFEFQAKWIVAIETGQAKLPSQEKMERQIIDKREAIAKYFKESLRHTIEEEHLFYVEELRIPRKRWARVPTI